MDQNKLWKILREMGIPDHLTCLLRKLYAGQEATVRTGHGTTDWFQIGKSLDQPNSRQRDSLIKDLPAKQETQFQSLGWEDLLEKEMANDSNILSGIIPWTEEPVGYNPWSPKRVRQDFVTKQQKFKRGNYPKM